MASSVFKRMCKVVNDTLYVSFPVRDGCKYLRVTQLNANTMRYDLRVGDTDFTVTVKQEEEVCVTKPTWNN